MPWPIAPEPIIAILFSFSVVKGIHPEHLMNCWKNGNKAFEREIYACALKEKWKK
jgi:hypothetical protein